MIQPSGSPSARLMIVASCPTHYDLNTKTILSDRAFDKLLSDAGISRNECYITSVIRDIIPGQNFESQIALKKKDESPNHVLLHNRLVTPKVVAETNRLASEIALLRPQIILAVDNGALFALTGKWGIKSWRGSILKPIISDHNCYVIPIFSPSYLYGAEKDRPTTLFDIRKAVQMARQETLPSEPIYNFVLQPSFSQTVQYLNKIFIQLTQNKTKLAVDIETRAGHIACLGIATSTTEAICIPFLRATIQINSISYWLEEEELFIINLLRKILTHPNAQIIGQNFIYDAQYIFRHFLFLPNFCRDTMIAQHSMFSTMQKGLDFLSSLYCDFHVYWKDESKNWDPTLGERQLWNYNCLDCVRTFEIDSNQQKAINEMSASWPALPEVHDFQQSLFWPVLLSMIRGIRVNNERKDQLAIELSEAISARESYLADLLGHPINIRSPVQMKDLFYGQMGQKPVIDRKSGNPTCNDAAIQKIAAREPLLRPLCSAISDLRSLGVFKSTFLEAPVDDDQRMRCSFNIAGTETYRFSSSENAFGSGMNLQNIPSGDEDSGLPNVRKLFIPDEGMEFFDIDLDSADLRIVVWESDCAEMKAMFAEGAKPYVEIAKEYYRDPTITKSHPSYKLFKALCHGTNYLGSAKGLSGRIGLLENEVERIQNWYYGKFPEIKKWQEDIKSAAVSRRWVENVFGYRLYIFDRIEGTIFNQVVAWIPQSTVACLINRVYKNLQPSRHVSVLLQVHDSLAGQYPIHLRDESQREIFDAGNISLPYPSGSLVIPMGIKTSTVSWGDCA